MINTSSKYYGKLNLLDGIWEGQLKDSNAEGYGSFVYTKVEKINWKYKGLFKQNMQNGYGKLWDQHGQLRYDGDWSDGLTHGKGNEYKKSGILVYIGDFKKGIKEGNGVKYNDNGKDISYDGEFVNNKREGQGKYSFFNIYKNYDFFYFLQLKRKY